MNQADPHALFRWARAERANYLLSDLFTFARDSGMCPDITEGEYREVCDYLESLLPNTEKIIEWRLRSGRIHSAPQWRIERALFMMPRRTFKTSLIAALCVFAWLIDNSISIVLGRSTVATAKRTLDGIKTHIERNLILREAFGDLRKRFGEWTADYITDVTRAPGDREPTIDTTGLDSPKTGTHTDLALLDDLVDETNYQSQIVMDTAWRKVESFTPVIERWGTIAVIGTHWGVLALYHRIQREDQNRERNGVKRQWKQYICGAYRDDGKLRFPSVLPESLLADARENIDPKMFAAWFLNIVKAESEDIFTLAYIQYVDVEYIGGPNSELLLEDTPGNDAYVRRFTTHVPLSVYMYVDPAPSVDPPGMPVNKKKDFTGIVVVGFDPQGNYWVLHASEMKKMPTDRLNALIYLATQFDPKILRLENANLDAPLLEAELRKRGLQTKVQSFDPRMDRRRMLADAKLAPRGFTKKAAQIEAMEPILRAHRVFFARGQCAALVQQLTDYPQVAHDDVLDAFAMSKGDEGRARVEVVRDPEKSLEDVERRAYEAAGLDYNAATKPKRSQRLGRQYAGPCTTGRPSGTVSPIVTAPPRLRSPHA